MILIIYVLYYFHFRNRSQTILESKTTKQRNSTVIHQLIFLRLILIIFKRQILQTYSSTDVLKRTKQQQISLFLDNMIRIQHVQSVYHSSLD